METSKSKLKVDYFSTLTSINNFVFTFKGKGKEGKAIRLIKECVGKWKYIFSLDYLYIKGLKNILNSWHIEGLGLGSISRCLRASREYYSESPFTRLFPSENSLLSFIIYSLAYTKVLIY